MKIANFLFFLFVFIKNTEAGLLPDGNIVDTRGLTLQYGSRPHEENVDTSKWDKTVGKNNVEIYTHKGNSKNNFLIIEVVRDPNTSRVVGAKISQKLPVRDERFKGDTREVIEYRTIDGIISIKKDFSASEGKGGKESLNKNIVTEDFCNTFAEDALRILQKCVEESKTNIPQGDWAKSGTDKISKIFPEVQAHKEELDKKSKELFTKGVTTLSITLPPMVDMCKRFNDYKADSIVGGFRKALRDVDDKNGVSSKGISK